MADDSTEKLPRWKRVVYLSGAAFVAAIVVAGFLEIVVRVFMPQPGSMRWLVPDEHYGHVMRPDVHERYRFEGSDFVMDVKTNALGLRGPELQDAAPGERTVVFMGDSVTFGHGLNVDARFDTVLEGLLAESGRSYRLINAGVNAWGTLQATMYVRDRFETFEPDVIVITFTGNDPSDDAYFREKGQSFDVVRFPGKRLLRDHSHLYRLLTHRIFVLYHSIATKKRSEEAADAPIDKQSGNAITPAQWSSTQDILEEFCGDFRAFNPDGVVMIHASAPWNENIRGRLQAMADEVGMVYVDMHAQTQDVAPADRRLPYDGHWSPLMHRIVAEHLFDALADSETKRTQ